jgi:hypothetical protein
VTAHPADRKRQAERATAALCSRALARSSHHPTFCGACRPGWASVAGQIHQAETVSWSPITSRVILSTTVSSSLSNTGIPALFHKLRCSTLGRLGRGVRVNGLRLDRLVLTKRPSAESFQLTPNPLYSRLGRLLNQQAHCPRAASPGLGLSHHSRFHGPPLCQSFAIVRPVRHRQLRTVSANVIGRAVGCALCEPKGQ